MTAVKAARRPASKRKTVAEYIDRQIDLCGKKQLQIAQEAGFDKPNMITMIKQGKTKLPLEKIGRMAKALEVDPLHLFRMTMQEYQPETWIEIQKFFNQPVITANEIEILEEIRRAKVVNPRLRTDTERKALRQFIGTLKGDNEA
jgi:transcriptional regulator with XRE-family HTH domain